MLPLAQCIYLIYLPFKNYIQPVFCRIIKFNSFYFINKHYNLFSNYKLVCFKKLIHLMQIYFICIVKPNKIKCAYWVYVKFPLR